ncbi:MAG TPA: GxxExxY protein [Flavitalea sp.]|nr:GxxExxY protein [Flavitalea sp.]
MSENEIAKIVVDCAFKIHTSLGPGLFESVYESIMEYELTQEHGLEVKRQVPIPVVWKNIKLELGFRSDMIIENKVILELKAIDKLAPVHFRQVLTYLKLTNLRLGLIINFDEPLIKNGMKRLVNGL